jgi:hypothetical protein
MAFLATLLQSVNKFMLVACRFDHVIFVAVNLKPEGHFMSSSLPKGWTEVAKGGMATNSDPIDGGIVDSNIVSGKWFVIFNRDDLDFSEGYTNRENALEYFFKKIN